MGRAGRPSGLKRDRALLFACIAAALTAPAIAFADPLSDPAVRTRGSGAQTIIGAPRASACANAAMAGRADAEVIADCDEGLRSETLDRKQATFTYLNRGAVHLRMGNAEAALNDFDEAIKLTPKSADALINRGAALVMLKRNGEAVATLTRALQLKPAMPETAYYYRATAREALNDVRGAYEDYNTALLIKPDWALVAADMARFARIRRDQLASTLGESPRGAP
jgi:tetratricopeptide (TPR) repeat protein